MYALKHSAVCCEFLYMIGFKSRVAVKYYMAA